MLVEICAPSASDALAAGSGGADRVELCAHLSVGGITPSPGAIVVARRRLDIPIHVLIRPRGGNFLYRGLEIEEMCLDIAYCKSAGIDGVVLGALTSSGEIDKETNARLLDMARPLSVTFHRAFDEVVDPFSGLETLIALGFDRVLTSGRGRSAREDLPLLAGLVRQAARRITILAGGSVRADDIPHLAAAGLDEIHIGSAACEEGVSSSGKVGQLVSLARESHRV